MIEEEELIELSRKMGLFDIAIGGGHMISGTSASFKNYTQEIHRKTVEEIITLLKDVPNPNANLTAINRIISRYS
jgi:hypothetical protein